MLKKIIAAIAALSLIVLGSTSAQAVVSETSGYDISWPQCGLAKAGTLPTPGPINVVGVNGGRVWDKNACLGDLLKWAGPDAQLYINTGNPHHYQSSRWPVGKSAAGRKCTRAKPNSASCAFVYGYLGAKDSYAKAVQGFKDANFSGSPAANVWWLDVELVNSWRQVTRVDELGKPYEYVTIADRTRNRANLSGAVYYLENVAKVKQLGIYSTTKQWGIITGGTTTEFSDHPVWYANGRGTEEIAIDACDGFKYDGEPDQVSSAFTGSAAILSQYVDNDLNLDINVPCVGYPMTVTSLTNPEVSVRAGRLYYLRATLTTSFGTPAANRLVSFAIGDQTYQVRTNALGVASKRLRAGATVGSFEVAATFEGDVVLAPASSVITVTVR